jgi:secreted trypsin-like serine protease
MAAVVSVVMSTVVCADDETRSLLQQAIQRSSATTKDRGRVIGGVPAKIEDNSWQVAIVWSGSSDNTLAQFCGGSIISSKWVVTAAHCIDKSYAAENYEILSGTDSLERGGVRSKVLSYIVHSGYHPKKGVGEVAHDNDIALLEIDPTGNKMAGIALQGLTDSDEKLAKGNLLRVTGWGVTQQRLVATVTLQIVELPYVDPVSCNSKRSYDGDVTANMLCAGDALGEKTFCRGDSGGPLSVLRGGLRKLAGVVSWQRDCGVAYMYGVFTRLSQYREWIKRETMGDVVW